MKRTLHLKRNPLVLILLLFVSLILLTSCGIQNKGSGSPSPSPNETHVSSPSTSVSPTTGPPMPPSASVPPTNTSPITSPPSLCPITPSSLFFNTIVAQQNPPAQQVTIADCGGPGNWTVSTSTSDGTNWLSSSPSKGGLDSGASQKVSIAVASASLPAGPYTGQVSFTLGSSIVKVDVVLTNNPNPPSCITTIQVLSFTATQGQGDPAAQSVTLTNCGSVTSSWSGTTSTAVGGSWLTIAPVNGTLNAGAKQAVTVAGSIANLTPGTYTGTIAFTLGTSTEMVNVTVTVQPAPS